MKNKSLLIIGLVWPEPQSSAAGTRMLQLIALFQGQGYAVVFASAAQESEFSFDLTSIGVTLKKIALNSDTFDTFIQDLNPAVVVFDRFVIEEQFGWRVAENCPNALRILDTEDLHCLRLARQHSVYHEGVFRLHDLLSEPMAKREIGSILRCDVALIISEFELSILQEVFTIAPEQLLYLPLFFPNDEKSRLSFEERKDFVFIGNFLHEPNWDAVRQLKEKIWPIIQERLPEAVMHIYGAYPSQKVLQLHKPKERFLIHGRADDAVEVIGQARVLLAPLRFGAGLKGKLMEAMQEGTASVTTMMGAEGIGKQEDWNGFVEDDWDVFAAKAVVLYQDKDLWENVQIKGFEVLKSRFDAALFQETLDVGTLLEGLTERRKRNFMGSLLWHHTALSTKYMSRWIEEKNKYHK